MKYLSGLSGNKRSGALYPRKLTCRTSGGMMPTKSKPESWLRWALIRTKTKTMRNIVFNTRLDARNEHDALKHFLPTQVVRVRITVVKARKK